MISALRMPADEVQLNRVLWTLCDDPTVAKAFCGLVLGHVQGGDRVLDLPPDDLRSVRHRALVGRTRRHHLRRLVRKGPSYVDLEFVGAGDWHLQVELKIDAGFGQGQLDRYAEHGPVAAIVRDPNATAEPADRANWVGAAAWADLHDGLAALPIGNPLAREDWGRLLRVMSDDGDFGSDRLLSQEVQETHRVLDAIKDPLSERFREALRLRYPSRGETFVGEVRALGTKPSERRWGRIRLGFGSYEWLAGIGVRDLWGKSPHLQVRFFSTRPRRRDRKRFDALSERVAALGYHRVAEYEFRLDRVEPRLAIGEGEDQEQRILELLASVLEELVAAGAYDLDVEYEEH